MVNVRLHEQGNLHVWVEEIFPTTGGGGQAHANPATADSKVEGH